MPIPEEQEQALEPEFERAKKAVPPEQYGYATAEAWVKAQREEKQRFAET